MTASCVSHDELGDVSALARVYASALEGFDHTLLDRSNQAYVDEHRLSGLFLPSMPPAVHQARRRIMIVGAETAGWNVLEQGEAFETLDSYIDRAMTKHERFARKRFAQPMQDRGQTFWNFMRDAGRRCGTDGLIYANLFCCDWKGGSPIRGPRYKMVQHYSARLLRAQVEFFAPSIIVFANGIASAGARRAVFPTEGSDTTCSAGYDFAVSHGIPNRHLWAFKLNDRIDCYRIQHPSSQKAGAGTARKFLLNLLSRA
jgi:hypothetical protein